MTWAIRSGYNFEAVEVIKETEKMVFYSSKWNGRETRSAKGSFLDWRGDEATARSLVTKLTSASAEYVRRRDAAANWYRERKAEILASAGEAGTAGTTKIDPVHEHATGEAGDAQELSHD